MLPKRSFFSEYVLYINDREDCLKTTRSSILVVSLTQGPRAAPGLPEIAPMLPANSLNYPQLGSHSQPSTPVHATSTTSSMITLGRLSESSTMGSSFPNSSK
ncbi:hypothetical protein FOMPIDRAFT_1018397 [Fomitopsis schrenkii]|uniref:Uncharacterized protein n=1 Tax=Fomitopsis schrenkii TaxID=2126942 RepID=S8E182_FOMSC|nr:hypothetical protein FOMPIDRAFT_1018397 [Fomitopsis schrenkii]